MIGQPIPFLQKLQLLKRKTPDDMEDIQRTPSPLHRTQSATSHTNLLKETFRIITNEKFTFELPRLTLPTTISYGQPLLERTRSTHRIQKSRTAAWSNFTLPTTDDTSGHYLLRYQQLPSMRPVSYPTHQQIEQGCVLLRPKSKILFTEYLEMEPVVRTVPHLTSQLINYSSKNNHESCSFPIQRTLAVVGKGPLIADSKHLGSPHLVWESKAFAAPAAIHPNPTDNDCYIVEIAMDGTWASVLPWNSTCHSIATIGQVEPRMSVPSPWKKEPTRLLHRRVLTSLLVHRIMHMIEKINEQEFILTFDQIENWFSREEDQELIRIILKDCTSWFQFSKKDKHGRILSDSFRDWCRMKFCFNTSESNLECSPEELALYTSMARGQRTLELFGISQLSDPKFCEPILLSIHDRLRSTALFIAKALNLSPWNRSRCLMENNKLLLRVDLDGRGNPFPRNFGYGYVECLSFRLTNSIDSPLPTLSKAEPLKKEGSDADLRRIPIQELHAKLIQLGIHPSSFPQQRWELVRLLRNESTARWEEAKSLPPGFSEYLRNSRENIHARSERCDVHRAKVLVNQYRVLQGEYDSFFSKRLPCTLTDDDPLQSSFQVVPPILRQDRTQSQSEEKAYKQAMKELYAQ